MPNPRLRLLLFASVAVLGVSLFVHLLTYVPSAPVRMGWTWPLHLATMAVMGGAVLLALPRPTRRRRPAGVGLVAWNVQQYRQSQDLMRRIRAAVPRPVQGLLYAVMVGAAVTFYASLARMEYGVPTADGGHYTLQNHGRKIRDLTEAEYRRYQAYEVRVFSSAWVALSLAAVIGLRYVGPRRDELMRAAEEPALPPDP
jgi:hypothetical protein